MESNILRAVVNIADFHSNILEDYATKYEIRINAAGEQLEYYLKDAISGTFEQSMVEKDKSYSDVFSWLGNQNNPPDIIIKNGDAYEIKKIQSSGATLALNNSPPKNILHSDDPRIVDACRNCEQWEKKDMFYCIGYVPKVSGPRMIKHLFIVQGTLYAADRAVYNRTQKLLTREITSILESNNMEFSPTRELGRVKRVDPLGITTFRMRGMWEIKNPIKVYNYLYNYNQTNDFSAVILVSEDKYHAFPVGDVKAVEDHADVNISNVQVKDPNNPANLINSKMIKIAW